MTLHYSCRGLGFLLCLATACAPRQASDARAARIAIDRTDAGLARWYAAGTTDSIALVFADSAWLFPVNAPPIIGRKAIAGYWENAVRWGQWDYTFASDEVAVDGAIAVERGHYSLLFTAGPHAPAGMRSSADHGHYLSYWRHDLDGAWRIVWSASVSEVPPMTHLDPP